MYKRRRGWWEEYGVYIQKSPTRDVWVVGFSGFGKRVGGPTWEFDSFEDANAAVEDFVNTFWERKADEFFECGIEGGLPRQCRYGPGTFFKGLEDGEVGRVGV